MVPGELKFKIVYHLYRYGPKSSTELSKALHESRQKIHYNITQLVKEGVLVKGDDNKYYLQPLFGDEGADLYLKLMYLMTEIAEHIVIDADTDVNTAIYENFKYFVLLNIGELKIPTRKQKD